MLQEEDNVVVLEQGSIQAQKIAKAMASPTAGDLFNTLSDGPLTATADCLFLIVYSNLAKTKKILKDT